MLYDCKNTAIASFFAIFCEKVCQTFARYFKTLYLCTRFRERNTVAEAITQNFTRKGRLAQLVQSVCLTSRGSAVRIRQRPHNGSLAQLYRASDYGSEGYRLESYRSHFFEMNDCLGGYQSGQMGQTVNLLVVTFGGSNPSPPTAIAAIAQLVEHDLAKVGVASSSLVCRSLWCVSSAWLEYMPVTHGVTGSSPVRTAQDPKGSLLFIAAS